MFTKATFLAFFCSLSYVTVLALDDDFEYDERYWDHFGKNLAANINKQVRDNLKGLDDLGPRITQRVHEGLRPVREMESRLKIKYGNGGTTIASFKDRRFLVRNGVMYECDGTISDENGSCSGTLQKATFKNKEDFCFANVNTIINNWYCIGNSNVNSGSINGKVYCSSTDNSPTLLISAQEYKNLCGSKANPVTYKYFTSQPLGDYGSEVQCSGTQPSIVCTMTENRNFNDVHFGGSYISISN